MKIEMGRNYQTRDGQAVRVLAVDARGAEPVIALITDRDSETPWTFKEDGSFLSSNCPYSKDLIEIRPEHTRWIIAYVGYGYASQKEAQSYVKNLTGDSYDGIAVVPVTYREGDGLL